MIVIYYGGGLGNKMFEYANAIALKQLYPDTKISFFDTLEHVVWYNSISLDKVFNISLPIEKVDSKSYKNITGKVPPFRIFEYINFNNKKDYTSIWYKLDEIINKKSQKKQNGIVVTRGFYYMPYNSFNEGKDYFLDGPWINYKYFDKFRNLIIDEFSFKYKYKKEKVSIFYNCNSVAIHVRRGDHLTVKSKDYTCDLCDMDYYNRAIDYIRKKVENPVFFFFSDDLQYIKEQFTHIRNKHIIRASKDYLDLQLMSLCKHAIISNSTFSFWGAYLNKNINKIIVAPKYYEKRNKIRFIEMSYPKEWIRLEV